MTLDEAIALSKLSCPAPAPAGDALRVLVAELRWKQHQIDELMLEYCPDEMTEQQLREYEANQRATSPEETAAINKALGK